MYVYIYIYIPMDIQLCLFNPTLLDQDREGEIQRHNKKSKVRPNSPFKHTRNMDIFGGIFITGELSLMETICMPLHKTPWRHQPFKFYFCPCYFKQEINKKVTNLKLSMVKSYCKTTHIEAAITAHLFNRGMHCWSEPGFGFGCVL